MEKMLNEGKKRFKRQDGIGKAKYTISFHDGKKKHKDGSDFFDIKIFKNKKDLSDFVGTLAKQGYKLTNESVNESVNEGKFKVDDLVYNKRTKTVGIVRIGDDKYGEVKTDADGNVDVDELEKYNPIKFKHQSKAKAAPSTQKEVNKRGLFNPFKNESVNEGTDIYLNNRIQITKFSGGKDGKMIQINAPKVQGSGDHIIMKIDDFKKMLKNSSKLLKQVQESVNESASKEAMGIAGFTGTRGSAVEDFINQNELNGKKLFQYVKKGGLKQRMEFVSAIAGKPGNKLQKMIISKFKLGESVNEGKSFVVMFKVKKDINNRNVKPSTAVYSSEADAKKFLQSVEKDGGNGMITRSNVKGMKEAKFGYKDSTSSYINKHKDEYKVAEKLNKGNEVKFYDSLSQMEEKIGHPKFMIFLSNALRGYKVDMYKDPKIKNPQDAQEALYLLSK
jgi:hypothetical protein